LDDIYNKLPPALRQTLIIVKRIVIDDFQLFCDLAGGADGDLRHLHKEQFECSKAYANAATVANTPTSAPTARTLVSAVTLNRTPANTFAYTTSATPNPFVKTATPNSIEAKCFNCEKVGHFARDYTLFYKLEMKEIEDNVYTLFKKKTKEEPEKDLV